MRSKVFWETIKKYPSILLLMLAYGSLPVVLSYQNAWMHPEQVYIKSGILKTGPDLNGRDVKNGLSWAMFEFAPRATRPLSSYFEILDTKWRCWLWRYFPPHPSLSLTWVFSLGLAPWFLYRLLKSLGAGANTAMAMAAFYLLTPAVLSNAAMLHRPAKPMANFAIIFCLWLACRLREEFIDEGSAIPFAHYLVFWCIAALSFYWDETVWLLLPAVFFVCPQVVLQRRSFLFLWCLLAPLTLIGYSKVIPALCSWAGHGYPHIEDYDKAAMLKNLSSFRDSIQYLAVNTKSLVLDTMGLMPYSPQAPVRAKVFMATALVSWWGIMICFLRGARHKWDTLIIFLLGLIIFSNYSMAITEKTWGPVYYGGYWSIFFTVFAARQIENAAVPKGLLCVFFLFILANMVSVFLDTNRLCKKCQYYWPTAVAKQYFQGDFPAYGPESRPVFSGSQIKSYVYAFWSQRNGPRKLYTLPKELSWLAVEDRSAAAYFKVIDKDFVEVY